jgi:hypothetical protein
MRKRYIQVDGVLYEKGTEPSSTLHIIPDIKPYKSMADGTLITSRSKHREHLKIHNCVEIGDQVEYEPKRPVPSSAKEFIVHQFSSMSDAEVRNMLRRDVQNIRWNSRKD